MFRLFDLVYLLIIGVLTTWCIVYLNTDYVASTPREAGEIALGRASAIVTLFMLALVVGGALLLRLDAHARARRMVRDALPSRDDMVRQLTPRVRPLEDYLRR